jgi:DNA-binding Lrp family transcriptional regulator
LNEKIYVDEMKAYVLINTELGQEKSILEALNMVEEVSRIHTVYGVYDLIVEVEAESMDRLKEIILNKVRRIEHVKNTITLLTYG